MLGYLGDHFPIVSPTNHHSSEVAVRSLQPTSISAISHPSAPRGAPSAKAQKRSPSLRSGRCSRAPSNCLDPAG